LANPTPHIPPKPNPEHTPLSKFGSRQVAGKFLDEIAKNNFDPAMQHIQIQVLNEHFLKMGVAPNETEKDCTRWVVDLVLKGCVTVLRSDKLVKEVGPDLQKLVGNLLRAASKHFQAVPQLSDLLVVLNSLLVIVDTSLQDPSVASPHAPSVVRQALQSLVGAPVGKTHAAAAIKYGMLANQLVATANKSIATHSDDQLAEGQILKGLQLMAGILQDRDGYDQAATCLVDVHAAVSRLTMVTFERLALPIANIFDKCVEVVRAWQHHALSAFDEPRFEQLEATLSKYILAAAPEATVAADSCEEPPMGQPDNTGATGAWVETQAFVDSFVVDLSGKPIDEWNAIMDFVTASAKLHGFVVSAARQAKVTVHLGSVILKEGAFLKKQLEGINAMVASLKSLACLPLEGRATYEEALRLWSQWRLAGGESDEGIMPAPFLERLCRGSVACASLQKMVELVASSKAEDGAVGGLFHMGWTKMVQMVVSSKLHTSLKELLAKHIDDAIGVVLKDSWQEVLNLQEVATIKRYAEQKKMSSIVWMFLNGSPTKPANQVMEMLGGAVARSLEESGSTGMAETTQWPHHPANDMAQRCLELLDASSKDLGMKCLSPRCV
jgi:hypothetical protein